MRTTLFAVCFYYLALVHLPTATCRQQQQQQHTNSHPTSQAHHHHHRHHQHQQPEQQPQLGQRGQNPPDGQYVFNQFYHEQYESYPGVGGVARQQTVDQPAKQRLAHDHDGHVQPAPTGELALAAASVEIFAENVLLQGQLDALPDLQLPQAQQKQHPEQQVNHKHHHHHHHHQQQQQPWPAQQHHHQQQQQLHDHSLTENIQRQVVLDKTKHSYQFTQVEFLHESTHGGEASLFYYENVESLGPLTLEQMQQHYQQQHQQHPAQQQYQQQSQQQSHAQRLHHRHQSYMYSSHVIEEHELDVPATQYYHEHHDAGHLSSSCATFEPMMPIRQASQTCDAASAGQNMGAPADASASVPNFSQYNKPSHNSNVESFPLAPPHYHYESSLTAAIRHYWREVGCLCFASAVFLNWLFSVVKRRFIASGLTGAEHAIEALQRSSTFSSTAAANGSTANNKSVTSKDTNSGNSAQDSAFEENASPMSLDDVESSSQSSSLHRDKSTFSLKAALVVANESPVMRQRSSTLKADPIPIPTTPNSHKSVSLSNSLSNTSEYNSRYSSDFDSIQRLGRGGFGIVFEAKNKIDDCHYAVKRICLPLEKEARERVMREVRALAKLDHVGIVRYYNAWLEAPPDEWLKQHDAQLGIVHSKDGGMSFPSTDGIYDKNESENITKAGQGSRLSDCGDNSSSLLGLNGPFKRRNNGYNKYLKTNSSSPSLDIVFEGSGSIRVEADENKTEPSNANNNKSKRKPPRHKRMPLNQRKNNINGDINDSDSEDSDFIQFESRKDTQRGANEEGNNGDDDWSVSSHLTEPFSTSSESNSSENSGEDGDGDSNNPLREHKKPNEEGRLKIDEGRKRALSHLKEMRLLNNASVVDNLQVEKVYLYIQMQLCRKDTLKDWLRTNCETRVKTTVFDLFYQIVDAVEYVHSQDLIHRDLKPSNIFFSLDGTLKIGDFGLCRTKTNAGVGSSLDLQEYVAESEVERGFEAVHTEQVGTQLYMSPEQLNGLSYNQKVDIFAMGLILLELLIPFKTQMQRVNVLFKARNNLYSEEFKTEHPKEHELVKSLLNRCPQKRPTATEIKQHDLLASAQLSQPVIERIYHRRRTISSNSSTE